jgi:hypothetical protein
MYAKKEWDMGRPPFCGTTENRMQNIISEEREKWKRKFPYFQGEIHCQTVGTVL